MVKAIIISSFYSATKLSYKDCVLKYIGFARSVLCGMFGFRRATDRIKNNRDRSCSNCQMFYAPLGTCGVPGDTFVSPVSGNRESFGCWCVTKLANRYSDKDCWARVNDLDIGWSDAERPVTKTRS